MYNPMGTYQTGAMRDTYVLPYKGILQVKNTKLCNQFACDRKLPSLEAYLPRANSTIPCEIQSICISHSRIY